MKTHIFYSFFLVVMIFTSTKAMANKWPKTIKTSDTEITVYQPQTESIEGVNISARSAISVKFNGNSPVFGAMWIDAIVSNDRATRISTIRSIEIPNIKFSDEISETELNKLKQNIIKEVPKWNWQIPTDQLITTYENDINSNSADFNNEAPEIVIAYTPSMLVYIDGEPILEEIDNSNNLSQVVNTPYCILKNTKKGIYYIYAEGKWYSSKSLTHGYNVERSPATILTEIQKEIEENNDDQSHTYSNEILSIIVKKNTAELIQFNGQPKFETLKGTNLLAVTNSDNYVFMDIDSQKYYVVISGRWYNTSNINGIWSYVPNNQLPSTFANIEQGSSSDIVLANIPGTTASREAILDNSIPQTAEVNRANTTVKVSYDGNPVYKTVDGTSLQYIENSAQTVIRDGNKYYCVDNGIWFVANNYNGPWQVATMRPQQVERIAPSCPVYNVKYVYIYDVTPDIVYVGYTPGYYGSYVYNRTVVYGTGYYYQPWRGRYYYPRPTTFGFSMSYNPWAGWSIGYRWSYSGWYNSSWSARHSHYNCGGYWGISAYRPAHSRPHPSHGYYGAKSHPSYYAPRRSQNVYTSHQSGVRTTTVNKVSPSSSRNRNNVYTDRQGNVYQQRGNKWETRNNSSWDRVTTTRTSNGKPSTGSSSGNRVENSNSESRVTSPNGNTNTRPSTGSSSGNRVANPNSESRVTSPNGNTNTRPSTGSSSGNRVANPNSENTRQSILQQAAQDRQRSQVRTSNYKNAVNTRSNSDTNRSSGSSSSRGSSNRR